MSIFFKTVSQSIQGSLYLMLGKNKKTQSSGSFPTSLRLHVHLYVHSHTLNFTYQT